MFVVRFNRTRATSMELQRRRAPKPNVCARSSRSPARRRSRCLIVWLRSVPEGASGCFKRLRRRPGLEGQVPAGLSGLGVVPPPHTLSATHACKSWTLTFVGWTSLSVIVIVIAAHTAWRAAHFEVPWMNHATRESAAKLQMMPSSLLKKCPQ